MAERELLLSFHGPYTLVGTDTVFESEYSKKAGVYIWFTPYAGTNYISYIGETGASFFQRMKEHLVQNPHR